MFVLESGAPFVMPRTAPTYRNHRTELHENAAAAKASRIDRMTADIEEASLRARARARCNLMAAARNNLDSSKEVVTIQPNSIHSKSSRG